MGEMDRAVPRVSTALITGVSRGLGKELARQYTADGWKVIGTERRDLEMTNYQQIRQFASKLKGERIDLLFCNAGISGKRGMAPGSFDFASWEEVLRVNLLGPAALAEALIENVAASERRTIAMMSSRLGSISESSGMTLPYSTSKAALNMLVKGLAATLASRNITVVALSPGWVRTDMGGEGAPLSPEASVRGLRKVIDGLKPADSGKFFSHDGSAIPW
jgi:NAD(P)-dependent dehydrogenase (short-subunit alcohol dehydrogenase family)